MSKDLLAALIVGLLILLVAMLDLRDQGRNKRIRIDSGHNQSKKVGVITISKHFVPDNTDRHTQDHYAQEKLYWRNQTVISVIALVSSIIAVVGAGLAFYESWRQADAAQGQLRIMQAAQQPFVWLSAFAPAKTPVGGIYWIPFSFTNTGQSVAVDVVADFRSDIGAFDTPPLGLIERFQRFCDGCVSEIMPPNIPLHRQDQIGADKMTPAAIAAVTYGSGKDAIWFIGRIDYKNLEGDSFVNGICYRIQINPLQFVSCPTAFGLTFIKETSRQRSSHNGK